MAENVGGWEIVRELPGGAQARVDVVRSPQRVAQLANDTKEVLSRLKVVVPKLYEVNVAFEHADDVRQLGRALTVMGSDDPPSDLGVLKRFHIPDGDEGKKAIGRFESEIDALRNISEPGIVKLLDSSIKNRWMVTEYHPSGDLGQHQDRFKGDALGALRSFRGLAAAVAAIHGQQRVHRDIKLANIFVASDGRLVLGDFGIVFFRDADGPRLTETYERAGTIDWMPPWTHTGERLEPDKLTPQCDVYALGKLLWCMMSGRRMLPREDWDKPRLNLREQYPDQPAAMAVINQILETTVVDQQDKCVASASELLDIVDEALRLVERRAELVAKDADRPCRVCARGTYQKDFNWTDRTLPFPTKDQVKRISGILGLYEGFDNSGNLTSRTVRVARCDTCGHIELFCFVDGKTPSAWE